MNQSQDRRDEGERRLAVINSALDLHYGGTPIVAAFAQVAEREDVSLSTLYRWHKRVRGQPRGTWFPLLIPRHCGGGAEAEVSPEAWEYFKAEYLRNEKPSATSVYTRLCEAAPAHGWTVPNLAALRRKLKREIPYLTRIYLRGGEEALFRILPSVKRDKTGLRAMEWINGDGYRHNVFVRWPNGKRHRPKTWFWQDIHSNFMIGWRTDFEEHTSLIRMSFLDVADKYGLPDHITLDNTLAAANKCMTGGVAHRFRNKIKDEEALGKFVLLQIPVHFTIPARGQSKPVERAFGVGGIGEYVDKHPLLAGAYTGKSTQDKPANYESRTVDLETFLKALDEGVRTWNRIPNRRTEVCRGQLSFEQAFDISRAKSPSRPITEKERHILLLAAEGCRVDDRGMVALKVGRSRESGANQYQCEALYDYMGQQVTVCFDPMNLHGTVFCYTLGGLFIGEARCRYAYGFGDVEGAKTVERARRTTIRAQKEIAAAVVTINTQKAARYLPEQEDHEPPEPDNVMAPRFGGPRVGFPASSGRSLLEDPEPDAEREEEEKAIAHLHAKVVGRKEEPVSGVDDLPEILDKWDPDFRKTFGID